MEKDKAVYTQKQMCEMASRTRSWTLNNPSGMLPFLPVQWEDSVSQEDNLKAMYETLPPYKKPHWLISLFMWLKLF